MLKKVLKYDLESIFKFIVIFYSLSLFFGILTRIFLSINGSFIMNIVGKICSGAAISMIVSILINNLMRLWIRFKNNFYGDESYLTHTLPVDKKTLYLSKVLTAVITLFTSVLVIGLTLFISYYSKENIKVLENILLPIANTYGTTLIKVLLAFLFVFFLEFANALQSGYTGIILGHKMNGTKIGFSVLFGFVAYIITQIFALFVLFVVALFDKEIMNLFFTSDPININTVKIIIYLSIIIYTISLFFGYIINLKLFKRGVNVD